MEEVLLAPEAAPLRQEHVLEPHLPAALGQVVRQQVESQDLQQHIVAPPEGEIGEIKDIIDCF